MEFPHPSRPGYYDVTFDPGLISDLKNCVDVLIPGNRHYPSASQARVVSFLESRSSEADKVALSAVVKLLAESGISESSMRDFEAADPTTFQWFRDFVYYGYYASHKVLDALETRGYDYHGAPQPLGYRVAEPQPIPQSQRGSYVQTMEVRSIHAKQ